MRKKPFEKLQPFENKGFGIRAKHVRNIKSARSLLGQIIYKYQREEISENKARTLAYLLITYSNMFKTEKLDLLEERLNKIENEIETNNLEI